MSGHIAKHVPSAKKIAEMHARIEELFAKNKTVTGEMLIGLLSAICPPLVARSIVYILMSHQILLPKQVGNSVEQYSFQLRKKQFNNYFEKQMEIADVLSEVELPAKSLARQETCEIVVTYPQDAHFKKTNVGLLYPALKRLILGAQKELAIVSPFFDPFGTLQLTDDLIAAAKRGVQIRIVTRTEESMDENVTTTSSIKLLTDAFSAAGVEHLLQVRSYHKTNEETFKQIFSVHAKLLISDDVSGYVGSANITSTSLYSNFEAGVILRGEQVKVLLQLFENLWQSAENLKGDK
jgi:cardiolipin synthase/putative cardiolipin synthase